jgi:hypothetical protein
LAEQTAARAEAQVLAIETNETEARAQLEALRGDLEQTRQRLLSVEAFLEVEAELPILLRDRESLTAEQLALDATLGNLEGERVRLGLQRTHVAERTVSNRRDLDEVKIAQTLVRYGALGPDPRAVVESSVTLEMCQALYSAARQIYESESTARVGGLRSQRDEYAKAMEAEKSELASDLGDLTAVDIEPLVDVDHAAEALKLEAALAKGQGELDRRHTEHTEARLLQKAFLEKCRYHDEAQGEVFTNAALAQARAGELAATLALARVSLGQVIATIGTLRVTLAELKGQVKELKTQVTRYPLTDVPMHEGLPLATPDELIDMGQGIIEEVDVRAAAAKLAAGAYAAADKRTDGLYTSFLRILGQEEITSTLSASMLADLTSTTADTAAENAAELADAFSERRKVLEDEIAQIEMDFASTIEELDSFVSDSIGILKSAISKTVPESIEVYGKAAILKVRDRAALNVASDTRRERLRYYLDRLIDNQRFPETGGQLAADAVLMALGTSNVGFRILKVSQHRTIEYTPIDKITGSGGERVIAATLLWAVMAKAKRDHMPRKTSGPLGVLSVDNFFGKLTNEEMLRLLRTFTRELGVQCIFTTLSLDVDVVAVYPKVLQFRKGKTALGPNGRSYVAQAPYQGLKDPATLKSTAS